VNYNIDLANFSSNVMKRAHFVRLIRPKRNLRVEKNFEIAHKDKALEPTGPGASRLLKKVRVT
jgi:hypothetical protein